MAWGNGNPAPPPPFRLETRRGRLPVWLWGRPPEVRKSPSNFLIFFRELSYPFVVPPWILGGDGSHGWLWGRPPVVFPAPFLLGIVTSR